MAEALRSRWRTGVTLLILGAFLVQPVLGGDLEYDLASRLDQLRRRFRLNRAISLMVASADSGQLLYSHNARKPFVPASAMKLVTMAAALHYLGPDYRFKTHFFIDGPIENGVLRANLYVKGSGDPALREAELEQIAGTLAAGGLREIDGNLVLDDSFFDDRLRGPAAYDNILKQGLPIQSALSYNFNLVELQVRPGDKPGAPATLLDGGYGYFEVVNRVKTATKGGPWLRVSKIGGRNRVVVSGRVLLADEERVGSFVAPDPPAYLASALIGKLRGQGVYFHGRVEKGRADRPELTLLYLHSSPKLLQMLEALGKMSNNFAAEQIFKAIGAQRSGPPASFESGARALTEYLVGLGFGEDEFRVVDGSGLSYDNRLSAAILLKVLSELYGSIALRSEFLCSLATGGVDGTLKHRFQDDEELGQVLAKTGSLAGVSSLSGFALSASRGPVAFSVLLNGLRKQWRADGIEDAIARTLLQY